MIFIKIICDLICGSLNAWGGYSWHNSRRFLMPIVIAITVSYISHIWYLGFMVLPVIGTLCLGYFSDKNWGRALWLFLQAFVIGIVLLITGHIDLISYILYIICAGILGGIYKNWNQIKGDFITGSYLGLIVFFVR